MSKYSPFPQRRYNIILCDPPWLYRDKLDKDRRLKYGTMSMDDIADLPIEDISEKDCFLFLWVTFPVLEELFLSGLIRVWGFEYKTVAFVWVKRAKTKGKEWFWGMGNYSRSNPEICLLCTKGKLKRMSASVHSIIDTPVEEHSRKPAIVRDKIVQLCGDLPRIELFARDRFLGWDSWGLGLPDVFGNVEGLIASRRSLYGR